MIKNGNIRFEAEGAIVEVTPKDDLITIKEKGAKKTRPAAKGKKSMKTTVKKEELNFEKKNK